MALTQIDDRGLKTPIDLLDDNQYNLQVRVDANNSYGNLEWAESHSGDGVAATFNGIVNAYTNFTGTVTYLTAS